VKPKNKAIVFFDGDCGLCSGSVRFLIKKDRQQRLYFAPLQGIAAQAILPLADRESLKTIIYQRVDDGGQTTRHVRSEAVLLALIDTGSLWRTLAHTARLLPRSCRDWAYDRIANNRKQWFKSATCRLPSKDEHARILP
jgi:predicted DCC family thiol-disulfide oxidoreductase YuxK